MCDKDLKNPKRRELLKNGARLGVATALGAGAAIAPNLSFAAALDRQTRDAMTPDQVIEFLKKGNKRFVSGEMIDHDYLQQKRDSSTGQYPAAVILSCIDSRVPTEIITNTGIGDLFSASIAGNVEDNDVLGSMEFACKIAGSKLVMVMGHTRCGAVQGAIANVQLGNLTRLLDKIRPAIDHAIYNGTGPKTAQNYDYVDAVAEANVHMTVENIRRHSFVLSDMERAGEIKIIGSMYDISSGKLKFL